MREKEIHKIKMRHLMLVILFLIVLAGFLCAPFINLAYENMVEKNEIKKEAITFLKANVSQLQPICVEVIENKNSECYEWEYYDVCYSDNSALISENGLVTAKWNLKYSNNNWYVIVKSSNTSINITNNIK